MSHPDFQEFVATARDGIDALLNALEKHYQGIGLKVYETGDEQTTFFDRMLTAIYFELIRAGYFK